MLCQQDLMRVAEIKVDGFSSGEGCGIHAGKWGDVIYHILPVVAKRACACRMMHLDTATEEA